MQFSSYTAVAVTALAALASAQTASPTPTATGVTPAQSSAFSSAVSAYASSFTRGPAFTGLGINLALNLPGSVFASITQSPQNLLPIPTTSFDLTSFATSPPTTFPPLPWETYLSDAPDIQSSIGSLRTQAVYALASSAQSVLSTSVSLSTPAPTPTTTMNAASANGIGMPPRATQAAVAGMLGAAVALVL